MQRGEVQSRLKRPLGRGRLRLTSGVCVAWVWGLCACAVDERGSGQPLDGVPDATTGGNVEPAPGVASSSEGVASATSGGEDDGSVPVSPSLPRATASTAPTGAGAGGTGSVAPAGENTGVAAGGSGGRRTEDGAGGTPRNGDASGGAGATPAPGSGGMAGESAVTSSGGWTASGGGTGGSSPDTRSALADAYPCDGSTDGYDVVVQGGGSDWTVSSAGSFSDLASALGAAYGALSAGRTDKESILVQGDGAIDASAQLKMPSDMVLNICGTIDVTGTASGSDRSPLYARDRQNIDIPHAHLTGNAQYGIFMRDVSNVHLGEIILEMNVDNSGLGIRIDNNARGFDRISNITLDYVSVDGTGGHGVETYGVEGLRIGRVEGRNTGNCGLILNNTYDAEVGAVHCENCAHIGTGYAAFRVANDNGNDGSGNFPEGNIHVGEVYARDGGRGIFSVSGSGGLTIDRIDLADTGNDAILLQNCYNTVIAAESGVVSNGRILLSNDTDNTNSGRYEPSSNVLLQNITLQGATLSEAWCELGDRGNRANDVTGGTVNMCID